MEIKGLGIGDQLRTIRGVEGITPQTRTDGVPSESKGVSFADFLADKFAETNRLGVEADRTIERAVNGEEVEPHAAVIALQKADISFRLMESVRDKLVSAYQQLVKTPIG
jgi:flagellar hook-basal body complex protein FliE